MSIEVRHITKTFGRFTALTDVSLEVPHGELVALLGPSGSGKTTLLRIIAGLEAPDDGTAGQILFGGKDVADQAVGQRHVGFVFQHYALFRHMTVFENVAFGLRVRPRQTRPTRTEIRQRVGELLKLIQLENLGDRYPSQLSGGQRQRVALARALAVEPQVLLLDEPFGALDARVRLELRRWLRRLHDEVHITSVFVTHDQEEALEVADRIVVMNEGRVEQIGTPDEVFHHPATEFVMNFLGSVNLFHGRVEEGKAVVETAASPAPGAPGAPGSNGKASRLFVRPHDLEVDVRPRDHTSIPARVVRIQSAGPVVKVELRGQDGHMIHAHMPHERFRQAQIAAESDVFVSLREAKVFVEDYSI